MVMLIDYQDPPEVQQKGCNKLLLDLATSLTSYKTHSDRVYFFPNGIDKFFYVENITKFTIKVQIWANQPMCCSERVHTCSTTVSKILLFCHVIRRGKFFCR